MWALDVIGIRYPAQMRKRDLDFFEADFITCSTLIGYQRDIERVNERKKERERDTVCVGVRMCLSQV